MDGRYLLDTNICIYIAKYHPPVVRQRFASHAADALLMSVITLGELRFGEEKSQARDQTLAGRRRAEGARDAPGLCRFLGWSFALANPEVLGPKHIVIR